MNKMIVSPWLSVSPYGPVTCSQPSGDDLVHLRQGELDGACGPYCLVMALMILGVIGREQAQNMHHWDGRTREGRLRDKLREFGSLVTAGTNISDLCELADCFQGKGISSSVVAGAKKEIVDAVARAVDDCQVPIVSVDWAGGSGHWLLVVGYQGYDDDGAFQLTHLLCLDPGSEAPKTSLWNAVVEVFDEDGRSVDRGRLPSNHWGLDGKTGRCRISSSVILKTT